MINKKEIRLDIHLSTLFSKIRALSLSGVQFLSNGHVFQLGCAFYGVCP
jgi:hypothetical protein